MKEGNFVFPLYLYPNGGVPESLFDHDNGRRPNLAAEFIAELIKRLRVKFIPTERGTFAKPWGPKIPLRLRRLPFPNLPPRYAESLRIDFPRLPLTGSLKLFRSLAALGSELASLHLIESPRLDDFLTEWPVKGDNVVERVDYNENDRRVWINKKQYFSGIPFAVAVPRGPLQGRPEMVEGPQGPDADLRRYAALPEDRRGLERDGPHNGGYRRPDRELRRLADRVVGDTAMCRPVNCGRILLSWLAGRHGSRVSHCDQPRRRTVGSRRAGRDKGVRGTRRRRAGDRRTRWGRVAASGRVRPCDDSLVQGQAVVPGLQRQPARLKKILADLEKLGDASFDNRDRAQQDLLAAGSRLRLILEEIKNDSDLERRTRVRALLKAIGSGDGSNQAWRLQDIVVAGGQRHLGKIDTSFVEVKTAAGVVRVPLAEVVDRAAAGHVADRSVGEDRSEARRGLWRLDAGRHGLSSRHCKVGRGCKSRSCRRPTTICG